MKPTHIEHIGIAVESIEQARKYYEDSSWFRML